MAGNTWTLKPGEIERRRRALGFSIQELADKADLERRMIERYESGERKRVTRETILSVAEALKCEPKKIADPDEDQPWTDPPMKSPAESVIATGADTKQAQRERDMGIDKPYLIWAGKQVPIMSFALKKDCEIDYAAKDGAQIAVCGKIRHYDEMPADAAKLLRSDGGASFFVIQREIPGLGIQGGSEYVRTVIYVPSRKHYLQLRDFRTQVAVIVRLVVHEPVGDWIGFKTFDADKAFRPWALVSQWVTARGELPEFDIEPRKRKRP